MRYWQVTTRRLSKAAAKLDMDGAWHPWSAAPLSWYRVHKKKIVQRATFDSDREQEVLFALLEPIEPLPELAQTTGFREELDVRMLADDRFVAVVPLGYPLENKEKQAALERTLRTHGFDAKVNESILYGIVPVPEFTHEDLVKSQEGIVAVRLLYQSVTQASSPIQLDAAADAFARMLSNKIHRDRA